MKSKIKDFVTHSHKEINFNLETHTFDIWAIRLFLQLFIGQKLWPGRSGEERKGRDAVQC